MKAIKYLCTNSVQHLKLPSIKIEKSVFPEGELYLRIKENIKGKPVTIITNITPTNILEVLFLVDAVKHAGGKLNKIIIPFLSYARQDKLYHPGEAVSGAVVCSLLRQLHVPITVYDIHSEKLRKYLSFEHRSILPLLVKQLPKWQYVVVSPDLGGAKRAGKIAKLLHAPLLVMKKTRTKKGITIAFSGNVTNKSVLIVDDMISTGTTLLKAVALLRKHGAKEIYCIATHGLFVGNAKQKLKQSGIKKIIVSNTLPVKATKQIRVVRIEQILKKG